MKAAARPLDIRSRSAAGRPQSALLQIRCFGRFEVYRGGTPVAHWRRDRARALLKYLVVRGRPMTREALLQLMWSDVDPLVAARSLRVVVHALRQAVGNWGGADRLQYVLVEGEQVLLNPAAPIWVDTRAFTDHVQNAAALERRAERAAAADEYAQAELIYRDDYLIEDLGEPWTVLRREELKDRYLVVLLKLADHFLEAGDMDGCIARCHKLLSQDQCREDAYQRLMYCHTLLGQRSRALYWFGMCEKALHDGLGIGPGERTRELYEHIAAFADSLPSVDWLVGGRWLGPNGRSTDDP